MNDKTKAEIFEAVNLIDWHNQYGRENLTEDQAYRLDELLDKWIHLRRYINTPIRHVCLNCSTPKTSPTIRFCVTCQDLTPNIKN